MEEILLREFRKMPFCWQDKPILKLINDKVSRRELPQVRNIYLTLTEIASNQNTQWVIIYLFDIAKISWLSEPTIQKWLEILKRLWIVYYEPQQRWQDGKFKQKEISLLNWWKTVQKFKKSSKKVDDWTLFQLLDNIEDSIEDSIEIIPENNNINIPFISFRNLYWKKIWDKNECEKKWNELKDKEKIKIIETLPNWILQFSDKQFQPYPKTYLNQKRWNDEIEIKHKNWIQLLFPKKNNNVW